MPFPVGVSGSDSDAWRDRVNDYVMGAADELREIIAFVFDP
jgi:hypothetical protein